MIPLYYYTWPPVLWLDWWCHHAAQSGQFSTLSMNPPLTTRIPPAPTPKAAEPQPAPDNRVIPFPFDRVKHRARNEGFSATLIILAPRAV